MAGREGVRAMDNSGDEESEFESGQSGAGKPAEEGAPAWTTTFGDLMSLLLTFFVLMYSMSELRVERFALARASLADALGGLSATPPPTPSGVVRTPGDQGLATELDPLELIPPSEEALFAITDAYLDRIAEQLRGLIEENGLEETLSVIRSEDGVRLRILSTTLFPSGSALVNQDKAWILNVLGTITASLDVPAVVSGHTDDLPIQNSHFLSNWELSAARAAGVARELVANGHDPLTLRVEAFGEHRPVSDNDTPEGRAMNRRVEILFGRDDILTAARRWVAEGRVAPGPAPSDPR